jgi:hypothetical protein
LSAHSDAALSHALPTCSCCSRGTGNRREFFGGLVVVFVEACRAKQLRLDDRHVSAAGSEGDASTGHDQQQAQMGILMLELAKRIRSLALDATLRSVLDIEV